MSGLTFRNDTEVDIPMQRVRILNHCYQHSQEWWEFIETPEGGEFKRHETRTCPALKENCEIFQDQAALRLDPMVLPCCGAIIPDEILTHHEGHKTVNLVFDEVEIMEDLRNTLYSEDFSTMEVQHDSN